MKKYNLLIITLFAAGVFLLLYFLLRDKPLPDSHNDDYSRVVAENKAFKENEATTLLYIKTLIESAKAKDSVIAALKAEKKATQIQADKYAATSTRLAKEVKELRRGDTSEFAHKCDSLAEQAQSFAFLYEQYKSYSDSLTGIMDSQNEDYITALEARRKLYDELKRQYDALMEAYKTLFADYTAARKTIKREKLKTKIAALLGLVGGAAAVLK
jgi:cell division protein FtsB